MMKSALLKLLLIIGASILSGYLVYFSLQKNLESPAVPTQGKMAAPAPDSQENEVTALVQTITAPSLGNFGAFLLLDGIEADVNAWHAPEKPRYPVAINAMFQKAVKLRRIGFQSQYGTAGNLPRAPKEVKIYGGSSFSSLEELCAFTLEFSAGGSWTFREIPKTTKRYPYYRIEILSNQGSQDYLTLQELKFYGEA